MPCLELYPTWFLKNNCNNNNNNNIDKNDINNTSSYITTRLKEICHYVIPIMSFLSLFLRNQLGESSKQGIQVTWSIPIHHVKWWISRFRGVYRNFIASGKSSFWYYLKSFRPFCNITGSSVVACCWFSISASTFYYCYYYCYYCYYFYC